MAEEDVIERFVAVCERFYLASLSEEESVRVSVSQEQKVLEYFEQNAPSLPCEEGEATSSSIAIAVAGEETHAVVTLLGKNFVEKIKDLSVWNRCNEGKNEARKNAHAVRSQERKQDVLASAETIAASYSNNTSAFATSALSAELRDVLAAFDKDQSLLILVRGIARWLELQLQEEQFCLSCCINVLAMSERTKAFSHCLLRFMCAIGKLQSSSSSSSSSTAESLTWVIRPEISNGCLYRLHRSCSRTIAWNKLDAKVGASDAQIVEIAPSLFTRVNTNGELDDFSTFWANTISATCPIL